MSGEYVLIRVPAWLVRHWLAITPAVGARLGADAVTAGLRYVVRARRQQRNDLRPDIPTKEPFPG